MRESRTRAMLVAGVVAVVVGAIATAAAASASDVELRSGVIPWALSALVAGVGLILIDSYRCGIGRPALLVRCGSSLAFVGLGCAGAFLLVTGILAAVGSDLLSTGDTLVSTIGTLAASVCTLLVLPIGLLALGVAVLIDRDVPAVARAMPLVGTLVFLLGPVLVAWLPESRERTVLVLWPLVLGAVWAAYGLLITSKCSRQTGPPTTRVVAGARSEDGAHAS